MLDDENITFSSNSGRLIGFHPHADFNLFELQSPVEYINAYIILGDPYQTECSDSCYKYSYRYMPDLLPAKYAQLFAAVIPGQSGFRVIGWYNTSGILKVSLGDKVDSAPPFSLGSTSSDVVRANGTPAVYEWMSEINSSTDMVWRYRDDSSIYFDCQSRRVVGYTNRGCLKVSVGTKISGAGPVMLGSTFAETTTAFGTPSEVIYNSRNYKIHYIRFGPQGGFSVLFYSTDQVIGWNNKGNYNINIGDKDPLAKPIVVGSSFADVIKAMGTPDTLNPGTNNLPIWVKYGSSVVYIDEKTQKVTSWQNTGNLYVEG